MPPRPLREFRFMEEIVKVYPGKDNIHKRGCIYLCTIYRLLLLLETIKEFLNKAGIDVKDLDLRKVVIVIADNRELDRNLLEIISGIHNILRNWIEKKDRRYIRAVELYLGDFARMIEEGIPYPIRQEKTVRDGSIIRIGKEFVELGRKYNIYEINSVLIDTLQLRKYFVKLLYLKSKDQVLELCEFISNKIDRGKKFLDTYKDIMGSDANKFSAAGLSLFISILSAMFNIHATLNKRKLSQYLSKIYSQKDKSPVDIIKETLWNLVEEKIKNKDLSDIKFKDLKKKTGINLPDNILEVILKEVILSRFRELQKKIGELPSVDEIVKDKRIVVKNLVKYLVKLLEEYPSKLKEIQKTLGKEDFKIVSKLMYKLPKLSVVLGLGEKRLKLAFLVARLRERLFAEKRYLEFTWNDAICGFLLLTILLKYSNYLVNPFALVQDLPFIVTTPLFSFFLLIISYLFILPLYPSFKYAMIFIQPVLIYYLINTGVLPVDSLSIDVFVTHIIFFVVVLLKYYEFNYGTIKSEEYQESVEEIKDNIKYVALANFLTLTTYFIFLWFSGKFGDVRYFFWSLGYNTFIRLFELLGIMDLIELLRKIAQI